MFEDLYAKAKKRLTGHAPTTSLIDVEYKNARQEYEIQHARERAKHDVEEKYARRKSGGGSGFGGMLEMLGKGGQNFATNMGAMYTGMNSAPRRSSRRRKKARYRWVRKRV